MADVETGAPAPEASPFDGITGVSYENGEIQFEHAPAEEPAAPTEPAAKSEPEPAKEPATDYEKRYNDLLPEFTRKSEMLARMEERLKALEAGGKPEGVEAPKDIWEGVDPRELMLGEPEQFKQFFNKAVEQTVAQVVDPLLMRLVPVLEHAQVASDVNELIVKYPDAPNYAGDIKQVLDLEGSERLSLEQAYHIAKGVRDKLGAPAETKKEPAQPTVSTPAPSPAPSPKVSREELERRAARLQPQADTGRAGTVQEPERKIDSIKAAFEQALLGEAAGR